RLVSILHDVLPEFELHRDFNDHVDGRAVAPRRREFPLAHGVGRSLIEAGAETLQQLDVADAAVAADDDLEDDVAFEVAPASFFRVIRLHLAQARGRRDAAAGAIRPAAGAAARARPDAGAVAFAESRALARPRSATGA